MSQQVPEEGSAQRALYLRWRPRSFGDVVGQQAVVRTLKNAVARGSVAHGYLLCGPRGTGKTSLARILYKALNCAQPLDGEPCGACPSCQAADAARALDLIEIDAASNRGIDDIRALRERVRFAPAEATWKVYIVDEAHQLTAPAWDAFLKTLEEPPPHTVFVLATTAAHKVPPTIVSRCQRFDLGRIPHRSIVEQLERIALLERIDLEEGVADRLARLADGGLRDALGMLEQVAVFAGSPVTQEAARHVLGLVRGDAIRTFVDGLSHGDTRSALEVIEDVAEEGADLHQFLDEVLFDLRAALLIRAGAEGATSSELSADERDWLRAVASQWAPGQIANALEQLSEADVAGADDRRLLIQLELTTAVLCASKSKPTELQAAPPSAAAAVEPLTVSMVRTEEPAQAADVPTPTMRQLERESAAAPTDAPVFAASAAPPARAATAAAMIAPSVVKEPSPADYSATTAPPSVESPSLAAVQARWSTVLDRFKGNLLAKTQLARVAPSQIQDGTIVVSGRLSAVEIQRLEVSSRQAVEALLLEEFGCPLRVKFAEGTAETDTGEVTSIAEYASQLFGGRLIVEESAADSSSSTEGMMVDSREP